MKRRNRYVNKKKGSWITDPEIEEALSNLKALSNSAEDRPRVRQEVAVLRQKGVPVQVLADHSRVCPATIWRWQKEMRLPQTQSFVHRPKATPKDDCLPQFRVLDVVRTEPDRGLLPKINFRAEWARMRLNFDLF
jgi:hypothetical protein